MVLMVSARGLTFTLLPQHLGGHAAVMHSAACSCSEYSQNQTSHLAGRQRPQAQRRDLQRMMHALTLAWVMSANSGRQGTG